MNKRKGIFLAADLLAVAVLVAFDQFTKHLAVLKLKGQASFPILDGVFVLDYVENRGSAFGMLQGRRGFLLVVGVVFIALIAWFLARLPLQKRFYILHVLSVGIVSGGMGNLLDRFRMGYVVDFFYFELIDFPVFNVADCYVVVSTICLFLLLLFVYREEELEAMLGHRKRAAKKKEADE